MDKITYIAKENDTHEHHIDSRKILGVRVLSKSGVEIGHVVDIKIHPTTLKFIGIILQKGLFSKYYIGHSYFQRITHDSIILNIDPSVFIKGKRVYTHEGRFLGKVSEVVRKGKTNEVKELIIKSLFKKDLVISQSQIGFVNKSVVLSKRYNGKQRYFWQKA